MLHSLGPAAGSQYSPASWLVRAHCTGRGVRGNSYQHADVVAPWAAAVHWNSTALVLHAGVAHMHAPRRTKPPSFVLCLAHLAEGVDTRVPSSAGEAGVAQLSNEPVARGQPGSEQVCCCAGGIQQTRAALLCSLRAVSSVAPRYSTRPPSPSSCDLPPASQARPWSPPSPLASLTGVCRTSWCRAGTPGRGRTSPGSHHPHRGCTARQQYAVHYNT